MKHVFSSNMVAHVWRNQVPQQLHGRNQQGNIYFENNIIYSYGYHFPLAAFFYYNNKTIVLVNDYPYSVTTSKHINYVLNACHSTDFIIQSENMGDIISSLRYALNPHKPNMKEIKSILIPAMLKHYTNNMLNYLDKAKKAIKYKQDNFDLALSYNNKLLRMLVILKAKTMLKGKLKSDYQKVLNGINEYAPFMFQYEAKQTAKQLEKNKEIIDKWRQHKPINNGYRNLYNLPVMLRLNSEEIETSKGARIPVKHAAHIWEAVKHVIKTGKAFYSNGHSIKAGLFNIDRIETSGNIKAGCHYIEFNELAHMAALLKLSFID